LGRVASNEYGKNALGNFCVKSTNWKLERIENDDYVRNVYDSCSLKQPNGSWTTSQVTIKNLNGAAAFNQDNATWTVCLRSRMDFKPSFYEQMQIMGLRVRAI